MASSSGSHSSSQKKAKQLRKYCVAGGPGKASCKNNSYALEYLCISFQNQTKAHFESHCFTQRLDIGLEIVNNAKQNDGLTRKRIRPSILWYLLKQLAKYLTENTERDTLKPDVPSTSTALLVNASDIASVDLPDETINTPTTPENKSKDLDELESNTKAEEVTSEGSHRTTKTATARKDENADQVQDYDTDEESIREEQDPDWDILEMMEMTQKSQIQYPIQET
ncbi:Hypothetical predicted protein [Paramuricea clavata]|uniref:Uncharacterized protein n=1 Tax=Paramuricea clavata TaxID=317549 RepID=A0A6S7HGN3_PARCT|nr:Hypothetical predicted protein [Paramuricea clavata]